VNCSRCTVTIFSTYRCTVYSFIVYDRTWTMREYFFHLQI